MSRSTLPPPSCDDAIDNVPSVLDSIEAERQQPLHTARSLPYHHYMANTH